jgi:hypothetical protein
MSTRPALSIGAVAGGPGASRVWSEAVRQLGRRVISMRDGLSSPLAINVVYQIPGRFLEPEFEGVRSGRFSRKEALLLIQAALPSDPEADASLEVRRLLRDAVALAEDFARQEGMIEDELPELRALVDSL